MRFAKSQLFVMYVIYIYRLCSKAVAPLCKEITDFIGLSVTTGAVCVYPARVADCVQSFKDLGAAVPVAAVATGFPTGTIVTNLQ